MELGGVYFPVSLKMNYPEGIKKHKAFSVVFSTPTTEKSLFFGVFMDFPDVL